MTLSNAYHSLTRSGRGALITDRKATDFSKAEIRELISRYQWLAFKECPLSETEVGEFLGRFGSLVQNERRKGAVLKIDGTQKDEVLLGEGFMPLHRDGALMGTNVELVGIYCVQNDVTEGGRTFISDIESASERVPQEILSVIRERGIEAKPVDLYYTKASDTWHAIPGFLDIDGESFLNVGFPYRPGEKPSWLVRIPGVPDDECQAMFETMRAVMMADDYCYYHKWSAGDLLLIDNRRTLHGREAFKGQRSLANIQVVVAS